MGLTSCRRRLGRPPPCSRPRLLSAAIRVLHTTDTELVELVRSPFAAESLSDPGGIVVVTEPGGIDEAASREIAAALASLPCIVLATGHGTAVAHVDAAVEVGVA